MSTPWPGSTSTPAWAPLRVGARISVGWFTAAVILARHERRRSTAAAAGRAVPRSRVALRRRSRRRGARVRGARPARDADLRAAHDRRPGRRVQPLRHAGGGLHRAALADARHAGRRAHGCAHAALRRRAARLLRHAGCRRRTPAARGGIVIGTRAAVAKLLGEAPPPPAIAGYALGGGQPKTLLARCTAAGVAVQKCGARHAAKLPTALGSVWLIG